VQGSEGGLGTLSALAHAAGGPVHLRQAQPLRPANGHYELQDNNAVVHHVEASSFPNIVGTVFVRTFSLSATNWL